jgi:hypothetical protein
MDVEKDIHAMRNLVAIIVGAGDKKVDGRSLFLASTEKQKQSGDENESFFHGIKKQG